MNDCFQKTKETIKEKLKEYYLYCLTWFDPYKNYKREKEEREKQGSNSSNSNNHITIEIDYFDKDRKERNEIKEDRYNMIRLEQEDFVDI